jgi:hypothetical protein
MSLKKCRIFALAGVLAAVGALFATASASAAVTPITEESCTAAGGVANLGPLNLTKPVNGFMEIHKLSQNVELKGGKFSGTDDLCLFEPGNGIQGSITGGSITFPAFTAPLKLAGQTLEITGEITQFGPGEGTIDRPAGGCPGSEFCSPSNELLVELNVQAKANLSFSNLKIFGLSIPVQCETAKPISLPFVKRLEVLELLFETTVTGSTTMPPVACKGILGPLEGLIFTGLFSGPNNAYSLNFGRTEGF